MGKITICTLALLVACMLAGCAGSRQVTAENPTDLPAVGEAPLDGFGLPSPSELRLSAYLETDLIALGSDYIAEYPINNVEITGTRSIFSPAWSEESPSLDGLAVAIFEFLITDYDRDYVLSFDWAAVGDRDQVWIGLGNVGDDRWDWCMLPAEDTMPFSGGAHLYYPGGRLLVAVAMTGTIPFQLSRIRVGTPLDALEPPTDVQAGDGTDYRWVEVSWTRSVGALEYEIYRDTEDEPVTIVGDVDSWRDTEVAQLDVHTYMLRAVNEVTVSELSESDTGFRAEGPPDSPTNVQATDGTYPDKIRVTWTKSAGATGYNVYRDSQSAKIAELGDVNVFDDFWVLNTNPHEYWVAATNAHGVGPFSGSDTGYLGDEPPPPPDPPTNVQATDGTYLDRVVVTWTKSAEATHYDIYRDLQTNLIGSIGDADSFDDLTLIDTDVHEYWVRPWNTYGTGDYSDSDTGYVGWIPPPDPPTDLAATDGTHDDRIVLTWTKSTGATGYEIYRDLQGYLMDTVGDVDTYDDTSVTDTNSHTYWLKAVDENGTSEHCDPDDGYRGTMPTPDIPTNLDASDGTYADKVVLTWTKSANASGYYIYRDLTSIIYDTVGDVDTYDDTDQPEPNVHTYWLRAFNLDDESDLSDSDTGYRESFAPDPPEDLAASDGTYTDFIRLTWTKSDGAEGYKIYRDSTSGAPLTEVGDVATWDDQSVPNASTHTYWLRATNYDGDSDLSDPDDGYLGSE